MSAHTAPARAGEPVLTLVAWDDPDAVLLREEQQAEIAAMYDGRADVVSHLPDEQMLHAVLVRVDGRPVACGALRTAPTYGDGIGELKRLFVRPDQRRRGLSRLVVAELERLAAVAGLRRLILETGSLQHEALGLYRSLGYRRIPRYGPYAHEDDSLCFARWLVPGAGTRVLVVNGTMGAGKTAVADAIGEALAERRVPHAVLDVDALTQVWPRPEADPFAQALALESLAAVAPLLRARGLHHVVLARVVESPDDREDYEAAFDGAEVTVVRVDAPAQVRRGRLTAREPEHRREGAWARSVELEAILQAAALDDAVVHNTDRPLDAVAAEVLAAAGW